MRETVSKPLGRLSFLSIVTEFGIFLFFIFCTLMSLPGAEGQEMDFSGEEDEEKGGDDDEDEKDPLFLWLYLAAVAVGAILGIIMAKRGRYDSSDPLGFIEASVTPGNPMVGQETELLVTLENTGADIEAGERTILVSLFEEFDPIDELDISDESISAGTMLLLPPVPWIPKTVGKRDITLVLEINGDQVQEFPFQEEVLEALVPMEQKI